MNAKSAAVAVCLVLLMGIAAQSQQAAATKLLVSVDEDSSGPYGGQRSLSCLRVYSDGSVRYAAWRNSPMTVVDKNTGKETRPERTWSVEHRLEEYELGELAEFLKSKPVRKLSPQFDPPHRPIDYFERTRIQLFASGMTPQTINVREYFVASLVEQTRFPSALIILMQKLSEIEEKAQNKGKPVDAPVDCKLKPGE